MSLARKLLRGFDINTPLINSIYGLGLTSNLRLCLDAGDAASYTSGQKWLDTSGGGYDFFRGTSGSSESSDPTFNGTPGGVSASEYWSFDGGDYFTYDATNETWMQNIHKNNALWSAVAWVYWQGSTSSFIIGNNGAATGNTGFNLAMVSSGNPMLRIANAGSSVVGDLSAGVPVKTAGWSFVGISVDEAAGAGGGHWRVDDNVPTFDATYTSPASGNATYTTQIAARGNGSSPVPSGFRMAQLAAWEGAALTANDLTAIYQATRGRFGV